MDESSSHIYVIDPCGVLETVLLVGTYNIRTLLRAGLTWFFGIDLVKRLLSNLEVPGMDGTGEDFAGEVKRLSSLPLLGSKI